MIVIVKSSLSVVLQKNIIYFTTVLIFVILRVSCNPNRTKRAIFRHNVLPFLGGKIPDSAFHPERLYTNRLNKNGIYTNDGIFFQERHPERHHFPRAFMPNTIKINIPRDNRNVAKPGINFKPEIIDTTYLVSPTVRDVIRPANIYSEDLPLIPIHSLKLKNILKNSEILQEYDSFQIFEKYLPMLRMIHDEYKK